MLEKYLPTAVVALLAFLIMLREFGFIGKNKSPKNDCTIDTNMIKEGRATMQQIKELHKWHDKEDGDGRKLWYIPHTLEKSMDRLSENISKQTTVLVKLCEMDETILSEVKDIKRKVDNK